MKFPHCKANQWYAENTCSAAEYTGYVFVVQVHDELLLEVPINNAAAAMQLVKNIMEEPFASPCRRLLGVHLPVEAAIGHTWASVKWVLWADDEEDDDNVNIEVRCWFPHIAQ